MIAANELRIGNWVQTADKCGWRPVLLHDGFGIDHYKDYEPIPLTPELLEKAGFVFDKGVGWWFQKGAEKQTMALAWATEGVKWVYNTKENVHLLYLHQLQNLFYALTGEELEIKL